MHRTSSQYVAISLRYMRTYCIVNIRYCSHILHYVHFVKIRNRKLQRQSAYDIEKNNEKIQVNMYTQKVVGSREKDGIYLEIIRLFSLSQNILHEKKA